MMKPIFLDFDGVLNDTKTSIESGYNTIQARPMGIFNNILKAEPDARVIITSSWRYMVLQGSMTLEGFQHLLATHGFRRPRETVCDVLPADESCCSRAFLVYKWLYNHDLLDSRFVCIDDNDLGYTDLALPFVHTDASKGLSASDAERVLELLK